MARRTKEQLRIDRRDKSVTDLINRVKWLSDPKFYKTNYWSMAHFQSWAVQGKAGGCCACHNDYYAGSLCNTRRRTRKGGHEEVCRHVVERLCSDCIKLIEDKLKVTFKRDYAP